MTTISKEDWIARCAAQYVQRGGLDKDCARSAAEVSFECHVPAEGLTPEEWADEDMTCWDCDQ